MERELNTVELDVVNCMFWLDNNTHGGGTEGVFFGNADKKEMLLSMQHADSSIL